MTDEITSRAFFGAVRNGDLALVRQYFAQPHVLADVHEMNALARTGGEGGQGPWFHGAMHGDFVFATIGQCGYVELLDWFFSQALFTDTLRALLTRIALSILDEATPAAREMLELVLSSVVYRETMTHQERHDTMAELLSTAAASGQNHWLEPLIAHGADPTQSYAYVTPLFSATEAGDAETVRCLVSNGAIVTQSDLVTQSVWEHNTKVVRELLQHGADPRSPTTEHNAALLLAAENHHVEIVQLLVRDGVVDVDVRDSRGRTPLMLVAADEQEVGPSGTVEMTKLLVEHNADLFTTYNEGSTLIHWAVRTENIDLLRLLLELGCNPNVQDAEGFTPLREVVECYIAEDIVSMLDLLLQCGADPFISCHAGYTSQDVLQRKAPGRAYVRQRQQFFRTTQNHVLPE